MCKYFKPKFSHHKDSKIFLPKIKVCTYSTITQIQTVRERRNFGEGISSRSVHGSSRHADLRHQEVWLTVPKLSIALNSKTASFTTWACTCDFFWIFKYGPTLQRPCPIALLLVAFAFGRPSCSNFGGQSFRRLFRKTKLIKFLGSGTGPFEGATRT